MADIDPKTLRQRCDRRMGGLARQRQPWESQWREVSRNFQVSRSRWMWGDAWKVNQPWPMGGTEVANTKLLDPTGVRAAETLANGLSSGLISPSRPWFRLQVPDPDLAARQAVKEWNKQVQDAIYRLFATTNFYSQSKAGYKELGLFGTEAGIITQHWRKGLVTHALQAGEYWIAVGDDLVPDTLYRACPMTVAQVVQTFAPPYGTGAWSKTVQQAYDASRYDDIVPIIHAIEPNPDRIPGRTDATNKRWRSIYWETGQSENADGAGVLQFSGFDTQPFWAARWEPCGMQAYSGGPGLTALGDGKQLQLQVLRRSQGRDIQLRPHMLIPSSMDRFNGVVPGGISSINTVDQAAARPLIDPRSVNPDAITPDIQATQQQVKDAFYTQLFLAILEADGEMTATEVNLRNMEKYAQLGPVIEANMNEKLRPVIDIAFDLLRRTNNLPPAPPELQGQELGVEFVSTLAQLQRSGEINAIGQTAQFTGSLVAVDPGAFDNIDLDKMIGRFADLQGLDADLMRSSDEVQSLRDARAKSQQAASLQPAAAAAKDGAQAAQAVAAIDPSKLNALAAAA